MREIQHLTIVLLLQEHSKNVIKILTISSQTSKNLHSKEQFIAPNSHPVQHDSTQLAIKVKFHNLPKPSAFCQHYISFHASLHFNKARLSSQKQHKQFHPSELKITQPQARKHTQEIS